jgi:hypothetical protein
VEYPDTSHMPLVGASAVLGSLMNRIGVEIASLKPADSVQQKLDALCLDRYREVAHARLGVIEDARNELFEPFYQVLVFWLMIIFGCFGLVAPRNSLWVITVVLCAVSLSSVIFVILDLSRPYQGFFSIPSTAMRSALTEMLAPGR